MREILSHLVAFETVGGNDDEIEECFEYIGERLDFYPFIKKRFESNGKISYVWLTEDTLKPKVLLNAHIDVVPGSDGMFVMKEEGGKLLGRGVSDMKFAVAVFIDVLKELYEEKGELPSLGIMLTSDEEVGGMNGVGYLVNEIGFKPGVVVIPDGGDNWHMVNEAKGVLHVKLVVNGESAHSSKPWEGKNAIDLLMKDLVVLRKEFPSPEKEVWETTMNIGQLHGGSQTNQVCDLAEGYLDFRHIPKEKRESLWKRIRDVVKFSELEEIVTADPFFVDGDDKHIKLWSKLITRYRTERLLAREHGASDGRFFTSKEIPVILSKPEGGLVHTENEWLDVKAMGEYKEVLKEFLISLTKTDN
ncbi:M20/M25/M40 family metallo-hydrolase [Patescibacteria group bacterium]|nr:M20/M25/M40 family metallo-hydrolase [Patescibacteria group bacterium]